jgi:hypothetical protein
MTSSGLNFPGVTGRMAELVCNSRSTRDHPVGGCAGVAGTGRGDCAGASLDGAGKGADARRVGVGAGVAASVF